MTRKQKPNTLPPAEPIKKVIDFLPEPVLRVPRKRHGTKGPETPGE